MAAPPPSAGPCYLLHPRSQPIPQQLPWRGSEGPGELSRILGPSQIQGPRSPQADSGGRGASRRAALEEGQQDETKSTSSISQAPQMEIMMREPTLVRILTFAGFWQFF